MVFKDYYKILDLETSHVSIDEIRAAYRLQAKKYHPDVNVGDKLAEERIKDINEAYRTLSVPAQKRKYDRIWNNNVGRAKNGQNKMDRGYLFNMFLGNIEKEQEKSSSKTPVRGENIETKIEASLSDSFFGKEKIVVLKNAEGKDKSYTIKLPEGIRNGEKIRLMGQGKEGKNGGKNGDLLIEINIKEDSKYKLKGFDLYTDLKISPWEAILGAKIEIPTIDANTSIYIPQGVQTGELIKIPEKGFKNAKGGRGDLYAEIKIMVPSQITKKEEKIFKELSELSKFNPRNENNII